MLLKKVKLPTTHVINNKKNNKIKKENGNKVCIVFTVLIIIKMEDFRSLVKVCVGLLNWSF